MTQLDRGIAKSVFDRSASTGKHQHAGPGDSLFVGNGERSKVNLV